MGYLDLDTELWKKVLIWMLNGYRATLASSEGLACKNYLTV